VDVHIEVLLRSSQELVVDVHIEVLLRSLQELGQVAAKRCRA